MYIHVLYMMYMCMYVRMYCLSVSVAGAFTAAVSLFVCALKCGTYMYIRRYTCNIVVCYF